MRESSGGLAESSAAAPPGVPPPRGSALDAWKNAPALGAL